MVQPENYNLQQLVRSLMLNSYIHCLRFGAARTLSGEVAELLFIEMGIGEVLPVASHPETENVGLRRRPDIGNEDVELWIAAQREEENSLARKF